MTRSARVSLVAALIVLVLAVLAWQLQRARDGEPEPAASVDAERIDPAHEGRRVSLDGKLEVLEPPHDTELGIETRDAIALIREVEMLQWREDCSSDPCGYRLEWSAEPVRSETFRELEGHANPASMPFTTARFAAREVKLGAFRVDAALAAAGIGEASYPVRSEMLPPNLAASLRECDGALCTGDAAEPAAGDLRVRYRVVPAGERSLVGVQRGDRLLPDAAR
ncbi:MAG TPA: TMEM43 family protein [Dokdonella sp.]